MKIGTCSLLTIGMVTFLSSWSLSVFAADQCNSVHCEGGLLDQHFVPTGGKTCDDATDVFFHVICYPDDIPRQIQERTDYLLSCPSASEMKGTNVGDIMSQPVFAIPCDPPPW